MKKTICLNMIVKNESRVIERCLASVKDRIDHWVIVDTGSTDGTQEKIRQFMRGIPGELYERPWVDFSTNRNEALALAKTRADYLLFIDADEQLLFSDSFQMPRLDKDLYFSLIHQPDGINYFRESLVLAKLDWKWVGPVHEALVSTQAATREILTGMTNLSLTEDGGRFADPAKYLKDAAILEKALKEEPGNSRYAFYLALSYANAKQFDKALKWHQKRISMKGSEEEIFYSLLSIGKIQENLKKKPDEFIDSYTRAYLYRPSRAEPLYFLANYYISTANHLLGYVISKLGLTIPTPNDFIFVQHSIYDTGLLLQFSDCAYGIGKYRETLEAYAKLLAKKNLTGEQRTVIEKNIAMITPLLRR